MAFADTGVRTVLEGTLPVIVTLAGAVVEGGLVGYSSGWKAADGSPTIAAVGVAAKTRASGEEGTLFQAALVNGFTGGTPGAALYLSDTAGYYSDSTGTYTQIVGKMVNDTTAFIAPQSISASVGTIEDGTVAFAKLAALPSTQLLVGSSTNVAAARAVTGDVTIGNTGVTAIGAGKVTSAMQSATAKRQTVKSPVQNIDNGAGATYDYVLLVPSTGIEITEIRVVYDEAESGTCAAANWSVGTSAVTGTEVVNAQALENTKAVGYAKICTLVEGTVAADTPIFARYTGVATTVAGATHLEMDYYTTDPA